MTYDRVKAKVDEAGIKAVLQADPQAVLIICSQKALAESST